ncbi:MAG: hypothetical protein GWP19_00070 [Planctomycetia bacterium]|nr:hypothetical protein [Planctomycetia bacterium]
MFWKRQVPIAIVALVGTLTLFGWFVDQPNIKSFVDDDATQWYDILASFAIFLGALNLMKLQMQKVIKRKSGWQYSIFAIGGFLFAFTVGFLMRGAYTVNINSAGETPQAVAQVLTGEIGGTIQESEVLLGLIEEGDPLMLEKVHWTGKSVNKITNKLIESGADAEIVPENWGAHLTRKDSFFNWMFFKIFTPLSATMFALLAFLVASASYRAFRIRNFEATLLLVAGIIIMLGRVPIGSKISSWFVLYIFVLLLGVIANSWKKNRILTFSTVGIGIILVTLAGISMGWPIDRPGFAYLPKLQDWIYLVPNIAGARAIMIGIGLGVFATSIRYILGIEKSYIGEK